MKENEIKITRNYSFWKHPFKWWRDRKVIKVANFLINYEWEHGMREEVYKMQEDLIFYGSAFCKDGKRIDPKNII